MHGLARVGWGGVGWCSRMADPMEAIRRQRSQELLEQVRADRARRDQATRELSARAIDSCRYCGYSVGGLARCPECGESASVGREAIETIIRTQNGWYPGWWWYATATCGWVFAASVSGAIWKLVAWSSWSWTWGVAGTQAAPRDSALVYGLVTVLVSRWWFERCSRVRIRAAFSEPGAVASAWRLAAWPWMWGAVWIVAVAAVLTWR